MNATTKPTPGSAAAVLESAVHSVAEGRYRFARLQLLWPNSIEILEEVALLLNDASAVPDLPSGLTAASVIERGKPRLLPDWLEATIDDEIARVCSGRPVGQVGPTHLVARIAAAVCIDVCADMIEAAGRRVEPGSTSPAAAAPVPAHHRHRMIDLESSPREVIDLGADAGAPGQVQPGF